MENKYDKHLYMKCSMKKDMLPGGVGTVVTGGNDCVGGVGIVVPERGSKIKGIEVMMIL